MDLDWLFIAKTWQHSIDTYHFIVSSDIDRCLHAIGERHAIMAARLLQDARQRTGDARWDKLASAGSHLEGSYAAWMLIARPTRRTFRPSTWSADLHAALRPLKVMDALQNASEVAGLAAATYKSLGHEYGSVFGAVQRAREAFEEYANHTAVVASIASGVGPTNTTTSIHDLIESERAAMETVLQALI